LFYNHESEVLRSEGAGVTEPRIPALSPSDWPESMRAALAVMLPTNPRHPRLRTEGRPKALNALGTLAQYPELTHAFHTFNGHILYSTSLTPRQRELLVLRVATVRGSGYEWAQHVVLAADVGLTADEIDRVAEGADAEGWSALDAAMLRAVDELLADALVADATWATLAAEMDVHQLMDLVFTVGAYDLLAMAFRSFGVELDEDLKR
jgi:alkylhydroperoxidase family enzyme